MAWMEHKKDPKLDGCDDILGLGTEKAMGYLPLPYFGQWTHLTVADACQRIAQNGHRFVARTEQECLVGGGAIFAWSPNHLSAVIAAHRDEVDAAGWPQGADAFAERASCEWVSNDHPMHRVIAHAYGRPYAESMEAMKMTLIDDLRAHNYDDAADRLEKLEMDNKFLLDALADIVQAQLGGQGSFSKLGDGGNERTEHILLFLLRAGRRVRAHDRTCSIPIPPEDVEAVRAAGGYLTFEEFITARIQEIDHEIASIRGQLDKATADWDRNRLNELLANRLKDRDYYARKIGGQAVGTTQA